VYDELVLGLYAVPHGIHGESALYTSRNCASHSAACARTQPGSSAALAAMAVCTNAHVTAFAAVPCGVGAVVTAGAAVLVGALGAKVGASVGAATHRATHLECNELHRHPLYAAHLVVDLSVAHPAAGCKHRFSVGAGVGGAGALVGCGNVGARVGIDSVGAADGRSGDRLGRRLVGLRDGDEVGYGTQWCVA